MVYVGQERAESVRAAAPLSLDCEAHGAGGAAVEGAGKAMIAVRRVA